MKKRTYTLEVIERNPKTDETVVVWSYPLPSVRVKGKMPRTREQLTQKINEQPLKSYEKEAMTYKVWFILNHWYPKHFYRISLKTV